MHIVSIWYIHYATVKELMLIDTRVTFEHVQVIRCNIEPELVERSRDVENGEKAEVCLWTHL
jgi:hypothetical protein